MGPSMSPLAWADERQEQSTDISSSRSSTMATFRLAFGSGDPSTNAGLAPAWAERAAYGSLAHRRMGVSYVRAQVDAMNSLVQAKSPDEMFGVLAQHRVALQQVAHRLPNQAAQALDRITRLERPVAQDLESRDEVGTVVDPGRQSTRARPEVTGTTLSAPDRRRVAASSAATSAAGGGRASYLASQLLQLIHLADVQRKTDEAQHQVRMSQTTPGASAGGAAGAGAGQEESNAPNMRGLFQEIYDEVTRLQDKDDFRSS